MRGEGLEMNTFSGSLAGRRFLEEEEEDLGGDEEEDTRLLVGVWL